MRHSLLTLRRETQWFKIKHKPRNHDIKIIVDPIFVADLILATAL